jgi:hypothetical protein
LGEIMKNIRTFSLVAVSVLVTLAFAASTASATELEVNGVGKNERVEVTELLKSGGSLSLSDTFGGFANTCTEQHWVWHTTTF